MSTSELPDRLLSAAADVIDERGLHGFSLREVARRAGVSHAAPGYFFTNTSGLLDALALQGFQVLRNAFQEAWSSYDDPVERLSAFGRAYVRTCTEYRAQTSLAFRVDVGDRHDPALLQAGAAVHGLLQEAVAAVARARNTDLDVELGADLAWAAMQGLLALHPLISAGYQLAGAAAPDIEQTADRFTELLIAGLAPNASVTPQSPGDDADRRQAPDSREAARDHARSSAPTTQLQEPRGAQTAIRHARPRASDDVPARDGMASPDS